MPHPEVDELRPKLKEILYDCAVEIRATKAALYLSNGAGKYELITEYGFRGGIRGMADTNDPLIDRCGRGRTAFFVNGLTAEPRLSELMYETATDRLLAAPIYLRGALVGVIDMRDKAQKQPFDQTDVPKAQKIADRIGALFANKNIFNLRFIALSESDEAAAAQTGPAPAAAPPLPTNETPRPANETQRPAAAAPPAAAPPIAKPQPREAPRDNVGRVATLIIEARTAAARIAIAPTPESLTEIEIAAAREVLRAILLIPGTTVAMFSAFGHVGGVQEIAARSTLADEAANLLQSKLNIWLSKRGESSSFVKTNVQTPFGTAAPLTVEQLQKVFTAPVVVGAMRGLYLTVGFAAAPDRLAHEMLASLLTQLQIAIEHSLQRASLVRIRAAAVEKLLEPDFTKYPELRRHCEAVATRAEEFARFLTLGSAEIEAARLVGFIHDVGMRLLDYEKLYRKKDLTQEELGILREHASVGAVLVEPLLGHEIARAVLCHHERVDGRGYPNELHGDDIPLTSRIVQLADAWTAMTDPHGYQPAQPPDNALTIIARGAGGQFDAELSSRFQEFMRGR